MTSSNIVEPPRENGHSHEKTPEEIQLEIARTRTAITEDLLAISERLSPQHLRESARGMMRDARDEAKEMIKDAKDAAFDSLVSAKDRAVETVSEKVSLLGTQARRASDLTVSFVSANAVAVSLVGFGVGFLLVALQRRKQLPLLLRRGYSHEHYQLAGEPALSPRRSLDQARSVASHASQAFDRSRDEVRRASDWTSQDARDEVLPSAGGEYEALQRAGMGARRAGSARTLAGNHKVAVLAVTVAAGLGIGLLWPTGSRSQPRARAF